MHKAVISNTSPIFYLSRIGYLELLKKLYGEVVVPYAVFEELEDGRKAGEHVPDVKKLRWIKVKRVSLLPHLRIIPDLGKGESEVLAFGIIEKQHLLIIDDALARRIAKLHSLKYTGTAGIILKAKKEGLISEVTPILKNLKDAGFYLKDTLIFDMIKIAGEVKTK